MRDAVMRALLTQAQQKQSKGRKMLSNAWLTKDF